MIIVISYSKSVTRYVLLLKFCYLTLFFAALFAFDMYVSSCASSLLLYFCFFLIFLCFQFNILPYLVNKDEYIGLLQEIKSCLFDTIQWNKQ